MSGTAIRISNVSKSYRMYPAPADRMKELLHPFGKKYHKDFWALRDVSLEVPKGTTFGIVGQNGSGKSTLLQIIAGILSPTVGSVEVSGRISALLELGAGFNKEFTGRENVFLQGAMRGITREEMEEKFDSITAFADIGHFIDQPVKKYSSGMYVRLAFACAINIDPEILIVDEALAVGDAMFQRRCYRRLEEFQKSGKTILFVSHNVGTVTNICTQAMFLDRGRVVCLGSPKEVVNAYSKALAEREAEYARKMSGGKEIAPKWDGEGEDERVEGPGEFRFGAGGAELKEIELLNGKGEPTTFIEAGEPYTVRARVLFKKDMEEPVLGFMIKTLNGLELSGASTESAKTPIGPVRKGDFREIRFDQKMNLNPGQYAITSSVAEFDKSDRIFHDRRLDVLFFKVIGTTVSYGIVNSGSAISITADAEGITY
ncbi:MAG: ABC transporter ATP-binding protein [Deltaproteobacteria bacterium]|nr:ABC transporter ATP-binding protein [Deltaproteobacteria bacterium]MBZ0219978.1 ABC transporter ATP-binding protein [Deltaproteobacteria bacterium]